TQAAAELVGPRTRTKGNANQQHSGRTQSRENVSRGCRAYVKPQGKRKKERFTSASLCPNSDLPSLTRGRSRMRESRTLRLCAGGGEQSPSLPRLIRIPGN